jgi:hypothetical protein
MLIFVGIKLALLTRGVAPAGCGLSASGQPATEPAIALINRVVASLITLMNSRRIIRSPRRRARAAMVALRGRALCLTTKNARTEKIGAMTPMKN